MTLTPWARSYASYALNLFLNTSTFLRYCSAVHLFALMMVFLTSWGEMRERTGCPFTTLVFTGLSRRFAILDFLPSLGGFLVIVQERKYALRYAKFAVCVVPHRYEFFGAVYGAV